MWNNKYQQNQIKERGANKSTEVVDLWLRKISTFFKCSYYSMQHTHSSESPTSSDAIIVKKSKR